MSTRTALERNNARAIRFREKRASKRVRKSNSYWALVAITTSVGSLAAFIAAIFRMIGVI